MMIKINGTNCSYDVVDGTSHVITSDDQRLTNLFVVENSYEKVIEQATKEMETLLRNNVA